MHLNTQVIYGILQINLMVDFSVETEGEKLSSFYIISVLKVLFQSVRKV